MSSDVLVTPVWFLQ